jgi:hypothetical protein
LAASVSWVRFGRSVDVRWIEHVTRAIATSSAPDQKTVGLTFRANYAPGPAQIGMRRRSSRAVTTRTEELQNSRAAATAIFAKCGYGNPDFRYVISCCNVLREYPPGSALFVVWAGRLRTIAD